MIKTTITIDEIIKQISVEDAKTLIKGITDSIQTEKFTSEMLEYFQEELDKYRPKIAVVPVMQFRVDIIESERGWGQKISDSREFATANEAWKFYNEFNEYNDHDTVPDWYMVATKPVPIK